ncbi:uncharacterized protein LTR77_007740 [Saxophila tyrrhenica]|uniref:Uncharacterized protein n=1 Tax=Saxophila tyrrhenica TaxID=1690608 RepID=A0AAV9P3D4_9PEZI|nr:hypothetical protein LTR77_007740 [Saxophila tyrrhenica]
MSATTASFPLPSSDPNKTPSKTRSFSDPPTAATPSGAPSTLAPSPTFLEKRGPSQQHSKDDHALPPTTPKASRPSRRPDFLSRGLSLQMPPGGSTFSSGSMPSPSHFPRPADVPLSPQLNRDSVYMQQQQSESPSANASLSASPATSLPRHSRGLDFSRACTNLHHSTLAEQSSPDSSPVILQRGMMIPGSNQGVNGRKGSMSSMMLDSPNVNGMGSMPWGSQVPERSAVSSSVGSVNMLASDSESSGSDDDASMGGDDQDDPIFTTPQVHKLQNPNAPTPFAGSATPGAGQMWGGGSHPFSPAQASLMRTIRKSRLPKNGKRGRKSSSASASGSGYSSLASPRTTSPPPMRSIESAANGGYFNYATAARSRRESLALGTDGLNISSGNDSGDEASGTAPSTPAVVRRAVTRRGNLLPKTKGFARIRAALLEEAAPVDTEVRREAETIRQVRERDGSIDDLDLNYDGRQTATAQSSPSLLPAVPEAIQEDFENNLDGDNSASSGNAKGLGMNFATHANRNSGGLKYWNRFDPSLQRTPPPPVSFTRAGSSTMSDINMDSEPNNTNTPLWRRPRARSSASDASEALVPNSSGMQAAGVNDDMHIKKFKRRREDDFDIATIKRRAVSPGMSAQNSPVLQTHSPSQKDGGMAWGMPPERKEKEPSNTMMPSQQSSRHGSGGSSVSLPGGVAGTGKKLGLQGMNDTNDGLMNMTID